jgi:hypothetical protein
MASSTFDAYSRLIMTIGYVDIAYEDSSPFMNEIIQQQTMILDAEDEQSYTATDRWIEMNLE